MIFIYLTEIGEIDIRGEEKVRNNFCVTARIDTDSRACRCQLQRPGTRRKNESPSLTDKVSPPQTLRASPEEALKRQRPSLMARYASSQEEKSKTVAD
jgi:hypothetical protein